MEELHMLSIKSSIKQLTSIFLSVAIILPFFNIKIEAASVATEGDWQYTINNNYATITKYIGSDGVSIVVPDTLGGKPVNSIGRVAIRSSNATSITIPDSVTTIADRAFTFFKVENISISQYVTSIDIRAFENCKALTSITIDANNPNYSNEDGVFFNKNKTTLIKYPAGKTDTDYIIPNSVTNIGYGAFSFHTKLSTVTISRNVVKIESNAFLNCYSLTTINVDPNNKNYMSEDGILYNKNKTSLICYPGSKIGTSYTVGSNVTEIAFCAFSANENLQEIIVDNNNVNYSSIDGVLFNKKKTNLICYPNGKTAVEYIIPGTVTTISDSAFDLTSKIENLIISENVTRIEDGAFWSIALRSVKFLNPAVYIGESNSFDLNYSNNEPLSLTFYGYTGSSAERIWLETLANYGDIYYEAYIKFVSIGVYNDNSNGFIPSSEETITSSSNPNTEISLNTETISLPDDFIVAAYSVDGGLTWRTNFKASNFKALLDSSKGLELWLTDKYDTKKRTPATDAQIIKFPYIEPRPKNDSLKVNYLIYADATGKTTGNWTLSERDGDEDMTELYEAALIEGNKVGEYKRFPVGGVPLPTKSNLRFSVRIAANGNIPASRPFTVNVNKPLNAPSIRMNYRTETIKSTSTVYSVYLGDITSSDNYDGNIYTIGKDYDSEIDLSGYLSSEAVKISIWTKSDETRPASLPQVITLAPRNVLEETIVSPNNKGVYKFNSKYEFNFDGKWTAWKNIYCTHEIHVYAVRIKSTAVATVKKDTGKAYSEVGYLYFDNGKAIITPNKSAIPEKTFTRTISF